MADTSAFSRKPDSASGWWMWRWISRKKSSLRELVRHRVDNVIRRNPERQRRELFVVSRVIRPLPGIAQIHVVADRHCQTVVLVVNTSPARLIAVILIRNATTDVHRAGHLIAFAQVVDRVKNRV